MCTSPSTSRNNSNAPSARTGLFLRACARRQCVLYCAGQRKTIGHARRICQIAVYRSVIHRTCHLEGHEVESRDLRTFDAFQVKSVRRSLDSLRSLGMTWLGWRMINCNCSNTPSGSSRPVESAQWSSGDLRSIERIFCGHCPQKPRPFSWAGHFSHQFNQNLVGSMCQISLAY